MGTENIPQMQLRHVGLFDFDGLYATVIDWAKTNGYLWHEKAHKHKKAGKGAEQELSWVMTKDVTEYIRFIVKIEVHMWDFREIKTEENNRTLSDGRVHIVTTGVIEYDWQKLARMGNKKLSKKFTSWLGKIHPKLDPIHYIYYDQLYYRILTLQSLMKKFFDMESKKHVYKGYLGEN